jgi:hypothetical protein
LEKVLKAPRSIRLSPSARLTATKVLKALITVIACLFRRHSIRVAQT